MTRVKYYRDISILMILKKWFYDEAWEFTLITTALTIITAKISLQYYWQAPDTFLTTIWIL